MIARSSICCLAGLHISMFDLIENQARNINIKRLTDIATALGVSTTSLLKEDVGPDATEPEGAVDSLSVRRSPCSRYGVAHQLVLDREVQR